MGCPVIIGYQVTAIHDKGGAEHPDCEAKVPRDPLGPDLPRADWGAYVAYVVPDGYTAYVRTYNDAGRIHTIEVPNECPGLGRCMGCADGEHEHPYLLKDHIDGEDHEILVRQAKDTI